MEKNSEDTPSATGGQLAPNPNHQYRKLLHCMLNYLVEYQNKRLIVDVHVL